MCGDIIKWIKDGQHIRNNFDNLADEELKNIVENRYNLSIAKREKEQAELKYLLAEKQCAKEHIEKIQLGAKEQKDLWQESEKENNV